MRLKRRTLEEANQVAHGWEIRGFKTKISFKPNHPRWGSHFVISATRTGRREWTPYGSVWKD